MVSQAPPPWDGPVAAGPHIRELGFLASSDFPDRAGPAYLLVALRARPTLHHFDPEVVRYWTGRGGRGVRRTLTRDSRVPIDEAFSWGLIRIVDRLAVTNEFLTFGGRVRAEMIADELIVVFESPAPILRRGGHSQLLDVGADHVGAFFGRLLLAVDFVPGFEQTVTGAEIVTLYAAFVSDAVRRFQSCETLRRLEPATWRAIQVEARRLRADCAANWQAGCVLAATISPIGDATARPRI
jgi:hypothetical protein